MNQIAGFRLCTLSNKELIKRIDNLVDGMYDGVNAGKLPTRRIPARPDEDFDLLIGELLIRVKESLV